MGHKIIFYNAKLFKWLIVCNFVRSDVMSDSNNFKDHPCFYIKKTDVFYKFIENIYDMNLQQLEYIVAVAQHLHFVKAAEKCFVTQATLSMMVKKLEEELDVVIFDRSRHPVTPTETGKKLIDQAKIILQESKRLREIVKEERGALEGVFSIGIIPTLAPYLLPLFLNSFLKKHPLLRLRITELTTYEMMQKIEKHELDAGLMATPLNNPMLSETTLFKEAFVVYGMSDLAAKKNARIQDLDVNRILLLKEGHCFRSQVLNLCELKAHENAAQQLDFAAGSIETLIRMVDTNEGITILPLLALSNMTAKQKVKIRHFKSPIPSREISLVTHHLYIKKKFIEALHNEIMQHLPDTFKSHAKNAVIPI